MALGIMTRAEACTQGLKRYFTGQPCKYGHTAERLVSNLTCIECSNEKQRQKPWHRSSEDALATHRKRGAAWKVNNKDRADFRDKEYRSRPEVKAARAAWYQANRERIRAEQTKRNIERSAENVERARAWAEANPERARELFRIARSRRRARIKGAEGSHTAEDLKEIFNAQKGRCAYCRASLKAGKHVDHIKPLARGGSNDRANIQYLCPPCNLAKNAKDPIDFARERGLLV